MIGADKMIYYTHKVQDEAAGDWAGIFAEAAKHNRSKITVEPYTDKDEISDQQRKWVHCKAGPIQELMREGWSFREAKEYIKVEYGREWFVVELTDKNFKNINGIFRWECRKVTCRKLVHPMDVLHLEYHDEVGRYCPFCNNGSLRAIAIRSITDVSVKKTNLWFNEVFAHFPKNEDGSPRILQPDPEWQKKLQKPKI